MSSESIIALDGSKLTNSASVASQAIELNDLPDEAYNYVLHAEESYDSQTTPLDENGQGKPYAVCGYGAQLAEVDVDTKFGTVKVTNIVADPDLDRVVNPVLAEGQIEGGVAQDLRMAFNGGICSGTHRELPRLPHFNKQQLSACPIHFH